MAIHGVILLLDVDDTLLERNDAEVHATPPICSPTTIRRRSRGMMRRGWT